MSVGVVTPFSAQARSIQSRLEQRVSAEERARVSMAVGTAHRFQGDERDVIVFSPVASGGLMPQTLDWLSGTPNLFNVAITRARSYLLVVRPKVVVKGYECDFVIGEGNTAVNIECDGMHHYSAGGRLRLQDHARDALIRHQGWEVVRIPAWKCLGDPDGVVREIQSALVKRSSAP